MAVQRDDGWLYISSPYPLVKVAIHVITGTAVHAYLVRLAYGWWIDECHSNEEIRQ